MADPTLTTLAAPYSSLSGSPTVPTATPGTPTVPNTAGLNSGLNTTTPSPTAYTIASGDTLSGIATKNKMTLQQLLGLNPQYNANPNLIKPGQSVNLNSNTPATPALPSATANIQTTPSGVTVNGNTGGVVPTPTIPTVPTVAPKVQYGQLQNNNGTIYNTQTKQYYSKPEDLAADLGVDPSKIDWSKIGAAGTGYDSPDYQIAEKGITDLMKPGQDETDTQGQIDSLESGSKLSQLNTEGQPIPLEFITGEQQAVEKRGLALEEPLQQKLARLQAKRTGALGASQFTLTQMDKRITDAEQQAKDKAAASKPTEVGNGGTLVDPTTGKVIYQAPYRTSGGGGGNPFGSYTPGADPTVDAWVVAVGSGNATMAQVPAAIRNNVALGLQGGSSLPPVVDAKTDASVKDIIAKNPGEWGKAADAINLLTGDKNLATKYDSWLKQVYQDGGDSKTLGTSDATTSPLAASRNTMAATRIAANFIKLPQYQLTSQGLPYLQRIDAAFKTPGSVSDQELLDSITKLSTAGNAISDAQVKLVTDGQTYKDRINVALQKLGSGGVLSTQQRADLVKTAHDIFDAYKKGYQPVYDQIVKQLTEAKIPSQYWSVPDLNKLSAAAQDNSSNGGGDEYQSYLQAIGIK